MPSIDINAGTIHYEATGPENGRPVVFVHGFMMGGELWRHVSQRLAGLGLRCIAPTWPLGAQPQAPRGGQAPPPALPARSPEAVRARLAGFQLRGRQGRANAPRENEN